MTKTLYISSQNNIDCYKLFCSVSKFLITNTTFFRHEIFASSYLFIIPLVSITYLVRNTRATHLVTIKTHINKIYIYILFKKPSHQFG